MRSITLCMAYYENPKMLQAQHRVWAAWPEDLKANTDIILVDDCSAEAPLSKHIMMAPRQRISAYRLTEKAKWNWIACRNLAASKATGEWLFLTDMDHILDASLLRHLHEGEFDPAKIYKPARVDGPNRIPNPKPHPNSWFMTKEMFWAVGGFDENYSGNYGTDGSYRRRCAAHTEVVQMEQPLVQYLPEHIEDCRSKLARKSDEQAAAVQAIAAKNLPIKTLSFPYERIL